MEGSRKAPEKREVLERLEGKQGYEDTKKQYEQFYEDKDPYLKFKEHPWTKGRDKGEWKKATHIESVMMLVGRGPEDVQDADIPDDEGENEKALKDEKSIDNKKMAKAMKIDFNMFWECLEPRLVMNQDPGGGGGDEECQAGKGHSIRHGVDELGPELPTGQKFRGGHRPSFFPRSEQLSEVQNRSPAERDALLNSARCPYCQPKCIRLGDCRIVDNRGAAVAVYWPEYVLDYNEDGVISINPIDVGQQEYIKERLREQLASLYDDVETELKDNAFSKEVVPLIKGVIKPQGKAEGPVGESTWGGEIGTHSGVASFLAGELFGFRTKVAKEVSEARKQGKGILGASCRAHHCFCARRCLLKTNKNGVIQANWLDEKGCRPYLKAATDWYPDYVHRSCDEYSINRGFVGRPAPPEDCSRCEPPSRKSCRCCRNARWNGYLLGNPNWCAYDATPEDGKFIYGATQENKDHKIARFWRLKNAWAELKKESKIVQKAGPVGPPFVSLGEAIEQEQNAKEKWHQTKSPLAWKAFNIKRYEDAKKYGIIRNDVSDQERELRRIWAHLPAGFSPAPSREMEETNPVARAAASAWRFQRILQNDEIVPPESKTEPERDTINAFTDFGRGDKKVDGKKETIDKLQRVYPWPTKCLGMNAIDPDDAEQMFRDAQSILRKKDHTTKLSIRYVVWNQRVMCFCPYKSVISAEETGNKSENARGPDRNVNRNQKVDMSGNDVKTTRNYVMDSGCPFERLAAADQNSVTYDLQGIGDRTPIGGWGCQIYPTNDDIPGLGRGDITEGKLLGDKAVKKPDNKDAPWSSTLQALYMRYRATWWEQKNDNGKAKNWQPKKAQKQNYGPLERGTEIGPCAGGGAGFRSASKESASWSMYESDSVPDPSGFFKKTAGEPARDSGAVPNVLRSGDSPALAQKAVSPEGDEVSGSDANGASTRPSSEEKPANTSEPVAPAATAPLGFGFSTTFDPAGLAEDDVLSRNFSSFLTTAQGDNTYFGVLGMDSAASGTGAEYLLRSQKGVSESAAKQAGELKSKITEGQTAKSLESAEKALQKFNTSQNRYLESFTSLTGSLPDVESQPAEKRATAKSAITAQLGTLVTQAKEVAQSFDALRATPELGADPGTKALAAHFKLLSGDLGRLYGDASIGGKEDLSSLYNSTRPAPSLSPDEVDTSAPEKKAAPDAKTDDGGLQNF